MTTFTAPHKNTSGVVASLKTTLGDTYRGFLDITHNSVALLGTMFAVGLIVLSARGDLRQNAEQQLLGWLFLDYELRSLLKCDRWIFLRDRWGWVHHRW